MWRESLAFALVLTSAALVYGAPAPNPWPDFQEPAPGPARSIGSYSAGCLQGAQELPLDGAGYQVMRPSRRRNFGHPSLLDYVRRLGKRVQGQGLGVLLVGDLSQARGGRAASGHASHQNGLDVDVWYAHPKQARRHPLALTLREQLVAESVVDEGKHAIIPRWRGHVTSVLRLAASDERVDRVFVNPLIKQSLCAATKDRAWLRKIRPWYGHADHFHARLGCAKGDTTCQSQPTLAPGDGCDELAKWLRPRAARPASKVIRSLRKAAPPSQLAKYRKAVSEGSGWPNECNALLDVPADDRIAAQPSTTAHADD
jgi:penicillin-insensitive murein DD-endopeptidase